jgi:hypothetical protein
MTKFRRLSITHAAMVGGDAAMIVALADSLFFSIEPGAARGRVLLFLIVSFAPFVVIAPLIGPVIDRAAGGRRTVIQLVAAARIVLSLLMASAIDSLALFPLVFAALVLQKTYLVCKQALVPSVVRDERDLVEANSKLGVIAGFAGFAAVIPAAIMQLISDSGVATLIYAALLFGVGLASATRLAPDVVAAEPVEPAEQVQLQSTGLQLAEVAMLLLRSLVGFTFFLLAFWLRTQTAGTTWFAIAVAMAALATVAGNAIGPRLRRAVREETMLLGALALCSVAGLVAALVGGVLAGVLLVAVVNLAAAVGRLAFESTVQRDAPQANRGRAFARFETRFQLGWAVAGLIPVIINIPGPLGFLLVGVVSAAGFVNYAAGTRWSGLRRWRRPRRSGGDAPVRRR